MAAKKSSAKKRTSETPTRTLRVTCAGRCGFEKRIQVPEGADPRPFVAQHVGDRCPDCRADLRRAFNA